MSIPQKKALALLALLIGAIWFGWRMANGEAFLPLLLLGFGLLTVVQRGKKISPEGFILGVLIFGYIVGNRGFAQTNLLGIFIGELGMLILFACALIQISYRKDLPFHFDGLGIAILLYVIIGGVRLIFDIGDYGILAIRDSAMCYYAAFYFLAQPVAMSPASLRFLKQMLGFGLAIMIPCYMLYVRFPDYFLSNIIVNGLPLIFYKMDLVGSFLGVGFLYFFFEFRQSLRLTFAFLSAASVLLMFHTMSRAALPGFALTVICFSLAKIGRVYRFILATFLIAGVPVAYFYLAVQEDWTKTRVYGVYEHAISLIDFKGQFHYSNPEARNTGANNRYRIEWWRNVSKETIHHNPWTGMGFGYDLASRFLQSYYVSAPSDFSARSPHSILMTVFGRLGLLGLVVFLFIPIFMLKWTWSCVQASRNSESVHPALTWWCMAWMLFGSASFGVVLEGPMGAIPFWSFLGIARILSSNQFSHPPDAVSDDEALNPEFDQTAP